MSLIDLLELFPACHMCGKIVRQSGPCMIRGLWHDAERQTTVRLKSKKKPANP